MGIFYKNNYIVNTGIIEHVFQCTTKMILLAKMIARLSADSSSSFSRGPTEPIAPD